jgi:Fcf2 pre-rRNA processing
MTASALEDEYELPSTRDLLGPSELDAEERGENKAVLHTTASGWGALVASASVPSPASRAVRTEQDWHEIPVAQMTPELKRDLILIENRAHLDPKRFYKSTGTGRKRGELPQRVHVGVVVEAPHEYLSGRLTKKQRKKTFADEVFSDSRIVENTKRRFDALQQKRMGNKRIVDPAARGLRKRRRGKR